MDFDLNEEQRLLKDSIDRLMATEYAFEKRKAHAASATGSSDELWAKYAELGLLALPFAEADGGIGGGPTETMIVMEALGRALALEPYFATVVLGGGMLRRGSVEQRARIVPGVASGELRLALAFQEKHSRYDLADVQMTAKRDGDGWVLDGEKGVVLGGDTAGRIFVTARTSGARRDRNGIGVFMVDAKAAGLSRRAYVTQDGLKAAQLTLAGVKVVAADVVGDPANGLPLVERVVDEAIAALCAEAIGVMDMMHTTTLEYLKTRKQFGVTIGSFQAVQHRAADMFVALEQARSMAIFATMMAADDNAKERARAMSAAKVQVGRSGRQIGQEAVQLHGGIGMTMEYSVGHAFKRMTMIDKMFGDADYHLTRLAGLGGLSG
ncbi:MAG: acyl-CoA dehydrogenase [Hyphomicrobiaceae bacterium]